jgi:hypothetical protein
MATPSEQSAPAGNHPRLWVGLLDELVYGAIIVLVLVGISWTSISQKPTTSYWVILTPVFAILCVIAGWRLSQPGQRIAMTIIQALQWAAVLVAMYLMSVSNASGVRTSNETGLMLLTLLALGVFVSGLHLRAWKLCVTGAFLAICVPVVAWVEHAALLLLLVGLLLIGFGLLYWWISTRKARRGAPASV